MASRQTVQREWSLLSNWLVQYHPHATIYMQVRVGPTPVIDGVDPNNAGLAALSRVANRWADAIFIENGTLNLVEAQMNPDPGVFSQLIHYARKLRLDPNWSTYSSWPLNLIALNARDDPSVAVEAHWYGIQWIVYQPSYLTSAQTQASGVPTAITTPPLPSDFPARIDLLNLKPQV